MSFANLVLGYQNNVLTGTVTASAAAIGLGADQLQNDQGNAAYALQTPAGVTSVTITVTCPEDTPWRGFGLFRTNLTPFATATVTVLAAGEVVYSTTMTDLEPGYGQLVHVAPAEVLGDTLRIEISDPDNPRGYLNIPLIYAGPVWQTARNYGYASSILKLDKTTVTSTRAGSEFVRNDSQQRGFDLVLGAVAPDEVWSRVMQLDAVARLGRNIFFVPNPGSELINQAAVYGRLVPASGVGFANNSARTRSWRATITERL